MIIKYQHIGPHVYTPKKREGDAAFDLLALGEHVVHIGVNAVKRVRTCLKIEIPEGYYGQLCTKSSHAVLGLVVLGGVIDSSYRGEIIVVMCNMGAYHRKIHYGDKICQLVILPVADVTFECGKLSETERGEQAFGSTGKSGLPSETEVQYKQ